MQNKTELMDTTAANTWIWGFTPQAEIWNSRFAMIGFGSALLIEVLNYQGLLHFWGFLSSAVVLARLIS